MAKFVRVRIFHAGIFSNPKDQMTQAVWIKRALTPIDKQRRIQIISIFPVDQITPEHPAGAFSNKHGPSFPPFCATFFAVLDDHFAVFHIHIPSAQGWDQDRLARLQSALNDDAAAVAIAGTHRTNRRLSGLLADHHHILAVHARNRFDGHGHHALQG